MQHIMQESNECQLTTIAMLSDTDTKDVRLWVESESGMDYQVLFKSGSLWNGYIKLAFIHFLNYEFWEQIYRFWGINRIGCDRLSNTPNLEGKGQITVLFDDGSGHAMAYADGYVHDPNSAYPVDWYTWRNSICKLFYGGSETIKSFSVVRYIDSK